MVDKIQCPHCGVPFPPRWTGTGFGCSNPSREEDETVGAIWATSCMSCDKPIIEFQPVGDVVSEVLSGSPTGESRRIPIFPVSKEQSIEIVIEIILNFENLRRQNEKEPEMTNEEREEKAKTFREKLHEMKDTVAAGEYMRMTQGLSFLADALQITQFITGAR